MKQNFIFYFVFVSGNLKNEKIAFDWMLNICKQIYLHDYANYREKRFVCQQGRIFEFFQGGRANKTWKSYILLIQGGGLSPSKSFNSKCL